MPPIKKNQDIQIVPNLPPITKLKSWMRRISRQWAGGKVHGLDIGQTQSLDTSNQMKILILTVIQSFRVPHAKDWPAETTIAIANRFTFLAVYT